MVGIRGRALVVSPADPDADNEVKALSFMGLAALIATAFVAFEVRRSRCLGPRGRACLLAAMWLAIVVAPFAVLSAHGPFRSMMAHFTLSFLGVCGSFRLLELALGTGPAGFDSSAKTFVVYFASPAEVLFDEQGAFRRAPPGQLTEIVLRLSGHMLAGAALLSVGKATDFVPFLEPGTFPVQMPRYGFPLSLPALWLQAAYVYCMLAVAMLMHRVPLALVGIDTVDPMRQPLLLSTSIRDFWGRRWNLVIHRLMKRTFFTPLLGRGLRRLGGFLAFAMSGLFHEYMWLAVNWFHVCNYVPGQVLVFFTLQFLLCAAEDAVAKTKAAQSVGRLPAPLRTALVTLVVLPAGPLFLHGLHGAGMMAECAEQSATLDLLPKGADITGLNQSVPFDWAFLLAAVAVTLGLRLRQRLRTRRSAGKQAQLAAQPPPEAGTIAGG